MNQHSPFLKSILQIRGTEPQFKFSDIFGVVDASRKHLGQVGCEGSQALRQMSIKTLVGKDKVTPFKKKNTTQFLTAACCAKGMFLKS